MIRPFLFYVQAYMERERKTALYRVYMSDLFRGYTGAKVRYADLIEERETDTRTADEIAMDVISAAGLVVT